MKFWINIPNISNEIKKLDYSEYLLGWFTFIHKNWAISIGKKNGFMVFITLEHLLNSILELEKNPHKIQEVILEDHGNTYRINQQNSRLKFIVKDNIFIANKAEFIAAVKQGTIKYLQKLKRLNSDIEQESYFKDISKIVQNL